MLKKKLLKCQDNEKSENKLYLLLILTCIQTQKYVASTKAGYREIKFNFTLG